MLLQRVASGAQAMSPRAALRIATRGGAEVLGRGAENRPDRAGLSAPIWRSGMSAGRDRRIMGRGRAAAGRGPRRCATFSWRVAGSWRMGGSRRSTCRSCWSTAATCRSSRARRIALFRHFLLSPAGRWRWIAPENMLSPGRSTPADHRPAAGDLPSCVHGLRAFILCETPKESRSEATS